MKVKVLRQLEDSDCGPTCLRIIADYYGKKYGLEEIRELCNITRVGSSLGDISKAANQMGFDTVAAKATLEQLSSLPLPAILHWRQQHFIVLAEIKNNKKDSYHIVDPGFGRVWINEERLKTEWNIKNGKGILLLLEKNANFDIIHPKESANHPWRRSLLFLKRYVSDQRKSLIWVAITLIFSSIISWLFPILTQKLIDDGVLLKDLNIIWIILLSQLFLFVGQGVFSWIRGYILVKVSMKISIEIIASFIDKLVKLPIKFFDSKIHTDILQRIEDQNRIEEFLSFSILQTLFSIISIVVLSSLLLYYNALVYTIFVVFTIVSLIWIYVFMDKRIYLDYSRFSLQSQDQSNLYEMITGMPEIKINSAQDLKVSKWKFVQEKLYDLKVRALNLNHVQVIGASMLGQFKNIGVTFICAYFVIQDNMTLGVMMSISYILGQLSSPLNDLVSFFIQAQEAKLSFDRMDEVMKKEEEDNDSKITFNQKIESDIIFKNVSFKYIGHASPIVLDNVSVNISIGKKTAIVGASGSGKTTLIKLFLLFYKPLNGEIFIDQLDSTRIHGDNWRSKCGVVMQDGYIYSGTILENIALGDANPDIDRVIRSMEIACIDKFVASLPLKYNTKVGLSGTDFSGGQKQRLLIARAVYKNPEFLIFDEATSALDAENERKIVSNLNAVMEGKTVLVVAHRLSTVQDADQIIVMDKGKIVEVGTHVELIKNEKTYYALIKNQLELGN